MELIHLLLLLGFATYCWSQEDRDWLVETVEDPVQLVTGWMTVVGPSGMTTNVTSLTLTNGLLNRTFLLEPDFGTIDFVSSSKKSRVLRALTQEAVVSLDGVRYFIGGLQMGANETYAYLDRSPLSIAVNSSAWHYKSHSTRSPQVIKLIYIKMIYIKLNIQRNK